MQLEQRLDRAAALPGGERRRLELTAPDRHQAPVVELRPARLRLRHLGGEELARTHSAQAILRPAVGPVGEQQDADRIAHQMVVQAVELGLCGGANSRGHASG
jgi:hypothetical protein